MKRDFLKLLAFLVGCYIGTGLSEGVYNPLKWSSVTTATWLIIAVGAFFIDRWWEQKRAKSKNDQ